MKRTGLLLVSAALAILLSSGVALITSVDGAEAAFPATNNGKIAFVSDRDGNREIYAVDPDGGEPVNLTNDSASDSNPAWSPDGEKLAFVSNRDGNDEVYTMSPDGSEPVNLTNDPANDGGALNYPWEIKLAWLPNGNKILFPRAAQYSSGLYMMNTDGSGQTGPLASSYVEPSVSPDGTKLAYVAETYWYDCNRYVSCHEVYDIHVKDIASGADTKLTTTWPYSGLPNSAHEPIWSPDGKKIAYTNGGGDIWTMNADGSAQTKVVDWAANGQYQYSWRYQPEWSPDGHKIAFSADTVSGDINKDDIFVVNADGSGFTNVTNTPTRYDRLPTWSPDSKKLAFASDPDGNWEIYTVNADGSEQTRLTNSPSIEYQPSWQPLGYSFGGFYSPVENPDVLNRVKAGSAIPVKFSLGGDMGLDVFAEAADGSSYPRSAAMACDSTDPVDAIEQTVSAGSSGLTYDAATERYTYVWKTQKAWTGCRQLVVKFDDGTVHRANFKLVK